jgi:dihydrofolate reductase
MLKIIVAISKNGVIGKNNKLPWKLPDDMDWFKNKTGTIPVVMGTKTFLSLPDKFRPLPNRENIVISRSKRPELEKMGVVVVNSWQDILSRARNEDMFVIGGSEVYALAIPNTQEMYVTLVHVKVSGDTFFPKWDKNEWELVSSVDHPADKRHAHSFTWEVYKRKNQ